MRAMLIIDMPENCNDCSMICNVNKNLFCPLVGRGFSSERYERNRHGLCPLKPVSEPLKPMKDQPYVD